MVRNILKDGTIIKDMKGHVVKKNDVPVIYEMLGRREHGNLRGHQKSKRAIDKD